MRSLLSLTFTFGLVAALYAGVPTPNVPQSAANTGTDWPQWRGPNRDGKSTDKNLLKEWPEKGPSLVWNSSKVNEGKTGSLGVAWSTVSIANGKLYTAGSKDGGCFVFCLDEQTGKILWGTRISSGGRPQGTPTTDGDRLYTITQEGLLACLDTAKGDVIWKKDLQHDLKGHSSGWGFSESPLVDGDKLVCTPGGDESALVALNKKTGEVIWKSAIKGAGGAAHSSIVIAEVGGIRQYVTLLGSRQKGLVGVNAANGKFLWSYGGAAGGTAQIPTPVVKGDEVFTSTGYGGGAALVKLVPDGKDGIKAKEVYRLGGGTLQNHHGGVILVGDKIYGGHGHNEGHPFCLDFESGKFAWKPVRGEGSGSAGVVYADGHLYFRWENNVIGLVEATPTGYKLTSKFQIPGDLDTGWPHPVVAHGRLYIRAKDEVLCYDLRQK